MIISALEPNSFPRSHFFNLETGCIHLGLNPEIMVNEGTIWNPLLYIFSVTITHVHYIGRRALSSSRFVVNISWNLCWTGSLGWYNIHHLLFFLFGGGLHLNLLWRRFARRNSIFFDCCLVLGLPLISVKLPFEVVTAPISCTFNLRSSNTISWIFNGFRCNDLNWVSKPFPFTCSCTTTTKFIKLLAYRGN